MSTEAPDAEQMRTQLQAKVFSSVAHDLRTPLTCIMGALQTLEQMGTILSPEQQSALVKTALIEAYRLDFLFSAMLDKVKP